MLLFPAMKPEDHKPAAADKVLILWFHLFAIFRNKYYMRTK